MNVRKTIILISVGCLYILWAIPVFAINIAVTPLEGGNSIRFGRIDTPTVFDREIRIRVTGSSGKQYQVYQRILQPLTNTRGESLDRDTLLAKGDDGSNGSGTLHATSYERLRSYDELIYTSDTAGNTDVFRMIYKINRSAIDHSGNFNGQLIYVVREVGGSAAQDEAFIYVTMEAPDGFDLAVEASSGLSRVVMDADDVDEKGFVRLNYSGFLGRELTVTQEFIDYPINEEGDELSSSAIQFYVYNAKQGQTFHPELTNFRLSPQKIYESKGSQDEVVVNFRINQESLASEKEGTYRGRLAYNVSTDTETQAAYIDFELMIGRVFELDITYPPEGMGFSKVLPHMPPQEREVIVRVKTNLARSYTVTQNLKTPLQNEEGEEIEKDNFLIKQQILDGGQGNVKSPDYTAVRADSTSLYVSDRLGTPVTFKVMYQLKPSETMKEGNYQTAIIYSLEEQ